MNENTTKPGDVRFLDGKRISLRALELGDAEFSQEWINSPDVRQFLTAVFPTTLESEKAWIASLSGKTPPSNIVFAVILKTHGHIGNVGIHSINWTDRSCTLGAFIGSSAHRRQGFGSEALMLILDYAFDSLGLHRACADAYSTNAGSLGAMKKAGFKIEGEAREAHFSKGAFVNVTKLAMLEEEWREIRTNLPDYQKLIKK
ncbi:MAG: GNAT family protein [bacterium]